MSGETVDLNGTVAIVTGAGRGLGRHFAQSLGDWGASVAAVGRAGSAVDETVEGIRERGGVAEAFYADVTDQAATECVVGGVASTLGRVGVLINNAGTMNLGRVAVIDPAAWWTAFEVNVKATMVWCQAALASMTARRDGLIVNVASTAAQWVVPAASAYIASKAAVISFTRVLAAELDGSGVRVFAFGPWARTDMTDGLATSPAFTDKQRELFSVIEAAEAARRLAGTRRMLGQIVAGELDDHVGGFLDSEAPPT